MNLWREVNGRWRGTGKMWQPDPPREITEERDRNLLSRAAAASTLRLTGMAAFAPQPALATPLPGPHTQPRAALGVFARPRSPAESNIFSERGACLRIVMANAGLGDSFQLGSDSDLRVLNTRRFNAGGNGETCSKRLPGPSVTPALYNKIAARAESRKCACVCGCHRCACPRPEACARRASDPMADKTREGAHIQLRARTRRCQPSACSPLSCAVDVSSFILESVISPDAI